MAHMMATESPEQQLQALRNAFSVFDKDGSGSVDRDEIKRIMVNLTEPMEEEDVDKIIKAFDTNGDGLVDYQEFCSGILEKKLFSL